jgi:TrkA-N domain
MRLAEHTRRAHRRPTKPAAITGLPDVTVHDLYALYPDFMIDARREQALLLEHDALVLQANGVRTVVLDHDAGQIDALRQYGLKVNYGDASRPDLLEAAGARDAKVLLIAIDDREKALALIETARKLIDISREARAEIANVLAADRGEVARARIRPGTRRSATTLEPAPRYIDSPAQAQSPQTTTKKSALSPRALNSPCTCWPTLVRTSSTVRPSITPMTVGPGR